jgi:DNA repair photolyase
LPFRYSANPYRGCIHACSYCYARNTHEYLGLNAGLDFETQIFVKYQAPLLFREFLAQPGWTAEPIMFCGVTDAYQPAEREFRLTRQCLEVAAACHQPVCIITKNALVVRDLPVLKELAAERLVEVSLSITSLDSELARTMEPRTSTPQAKLRAIRELTAAGVAVRVMVAPLIPGLNDHEAPAILEAAREAGAVDAHYILLRLPQTVEPVFLEWLRRTQPTRADKVEHLIRQTRQGKLYRSEWSQRQTGTGVLADQIAQMFQLFRQKLGYHSTPPLRTDLFEPPLPNDGQLRLF